MFKTILCVSVLGQNVHPSVEVATESSDDPEEQGIIFFFLMLGDQERLQGGGDRSGKQICQAGVKCARGWRQGHLSRHYLQGAGRSRESRGGHRHILDKCVPDAIIQGW